jgi:hypothetical protein
MYPDPKSLKPVLGILKIIYRSCVNRYEAIAALSSANNMLYAMEGPLLRCDALGTEETKFTRQEPED